MWQPMRVWILYYGVVYFSENMGHGEFDDPMPVVEGPMYAAPALGDIDGDKEGDTFYIGGKWQIDF